MNLDQTFAVLFWLVRKTINNLGQAPIYTRITIDGARTEITTSRTIDPDFWDTEKERVTGSHPDAFGVVNVVGVFIKDYSTNIHHQDLTSESL